MTASFTEGHSDPTVQPVPASVVEKVDAADQLLSVGAGFNLDPAVGGVRGRAVWCFSTTTCRFRWAWDGRVV